MTRSRPGRWCVVVCAVMIFCWTVGLPWAEAGLPVECTALPDAQQTACKEQVAKECGHLTKYWPKVHCEDKIAKSLDVCQSEEVKTRCRALYLDSQVCTQANSMKDTYGKIDPRWIAAAQKYPGFLIEIRAFKPTWEGCNKKIPDCDMVEYTHRNCDKAGDVFSSGWQEYYEWFKSENLKRPLRFIKHAVEAKQLLDKLKPVVEMTRIPLFKVNDTRIADAVEELTKLLAKKQAEEQAVEARQWKKAGMFKKVHMKGGWANCIFADKPLGKKESKADQPGEVFTKPARIYARCYTGKNLGRIKKGEPFRAQYYLNSASTNAGFPEEIKGKPKVFTFEVTGDEMLWNQLTNLHTGEHQVAISVGGRTGKILERSKILHSGAGGAYTTNRVVQDASIVSKGKFTYTVSAQQDDEAARLKGGSAKKKVIEQKRREKYIKGK